MRILVVAAHPDDEVLGCGGTIARLAGEGHDVAIAIMGEGLSSRQARREDTAQAELDHLRACAREASRLLGANRILLNSLPDNRMDSVPLLEVVHLVERVIDEVKPEAIYTHHAGDLNVDHAVISRAVLTATRPVAGCGVRELWTFETPSSTEWTFGRIEPVFRPSLFVNIAGTLETKIAAMAVYESESRPFPHPRSPESLRAAAQRWGSVAGLAAAEAFELVRAIRY